MWEYEDRVWGQRQIFMKQDAVRDIEGNYEEVIAREILSA